MSFCVTLLICILLFVQVLFSPVRQHWLTVHGAAKSVHVYDSMAGGASQQTRATVRTLAGKRIRICYRSVSSPNCPGCEVSVSPLGVLRKCPEISTELSQH